MSHRRQIEPQWLRELAEQCLPAAKDQLPVTLSALIKPVAEKRGLDPKDLALRMAKLWVAQGHLRDYRLQVQD